MIQVRVRAVMPWAVVVAAVLMPVVAFADETERPATDEIFEQVDEKEDTEKKDADEPVIPAPVKKKNGTATKEKGDAVEKERIIAPQMEEYFEFAEPGAIADEEVVAMACPPSRAASRQDYAVFDVLFLQRDDATNNQPLAIANDNSPNPGKFLMTTRSMTPTVAPGVRLFYGRRNADCTGWEAGYVGVYGMYGDALAAGTNQVNVPGDLGENVPGFTDATFVQGDYWSSLNSAELNVFRSNCFEGCDPCARFACHRCYHRTTVDWLAGFRWASLEEQATLGVIGRAGDRPTPYTVNASSNLIGFQVGVRGRTEWRRIAFEGGIKTALAGATLYQSQSDIASPINGFVARPARSSSTGGVGMIADINLAAIYRINRVWGLRAGYNMLWLSGVALAPSQFDFSFNGDSGLGLDHGAGLFLNGASLGLEARW